VLIVLTTLGGNAVGQSAAPTPPKVVEWINRQVTMPQAATVLKAPDPAAETIGRLDQGGSVRALGVVAGGAFVQIRLPDGQTLGYVPRAALAAVLDAAPPSAALPAAPAPAPSAPPRISGQAIVVDTATLVVGGRMRALAGVQGLAGSHAQALQAFIQGAGGAVACEPANPGQVTCRTANGVDVAMAALVNGSALAVPGAPDAYAQQEATARAARRGIWQGQVNTAQPLAGDNAAPATPSAPSAQHRSSGRWLSYWSVADVSGSQRCGMETAWRGGTAHFALDVFPTAAGPGLLLTLRDEGWDLTAPLSDTGEIVVDRTPLPASFGHTAEMAPTVLAARMTNPADAPGLLTRMKAGALFWVTSPLGRTPALSLAGAGPAIDALARCLAR